MIGSKKLLIISYVKPYPPDSGGSAGIFNLLKAIKHQINITLIFPLDPDKENELEEFKKACPEIETLPLIKPHVETSNTKKLKRKGKVWLSRFKEAFSNDPDFETKRRASLFIPPPNDVSKALKEHVKEVISKKDFDLFQVEFYPYLELISILPKDKPRIFVHHELRMVRANQEFDLLHNPENKYAEQLKKIKNQELTLLHKYDKVIVLSEEDKKILESLNFQKEIFISQLTISPKPSPANAIKTRHRLIFIGGSSHFPNADAINWFLSNVWNKLLEAYPLLELNITGYWEKRYRSKFGKYRNVKFKGYVEDLHSLSAGSILIVPIRIGSGMRMKIIEGINLCIPMVSTSVGGMGMHLKHGEAIEIADNATDFAKSVTMLLQNPQKGDEYVRQSQKVFDNYFNANLIGQKRISVYKAALNGQPYNKNSLHHSNI